MSDSKKPKLSEIKAQTEAARKAGFVGPSIPYLLDLVKRMGEALEPFVNKQLFACEYCVIEINSMGHLAHQENCPVPKARELLKEISL